MPLITGISDEIVALELGAVMTKGTPDEVMANPHVVASYLGTTEATINRSGDAGMALAGRQVAAAAEAVPKKRASSRPKAPTNGTGGRSKTNGSGNGHGQESGNGHGDALDLTAFAPGADDAMVPEAPARRPRRPTDGPRRPLAAPSRSATTDDTTAPRPRQRPKA